MILSHKHKFIFIKTNKTAGTSVEIALSKFCGSDDIITKISEKDEETRVALGYPCAQNYTIDDNGLLECYNHMPATEVKAGVSDQIWKSYYKFCIERNPWDRVISLYYWRPHNNSDEGVMFNDFVHSDALKILKKRGIDLYTLNHKVIVNRILRFENIEEEMARLKRKLGLDADILLPRAKSHTRKDRRPYVEVYSKKEQLAVAKMFDREIRLMGYTFNTHRN